MLKQWLPVNTVVREQFRTLIVLYVQRKMERSFLAGRELEIGLGDSKEWLNELRKVDECDDPIFNTETYEEMNKRVKQEYDDGVCEGEYVHPREDTVTEGEEHHNLWINYYDYANQRVIEELEKIKGLGVTYTDDVINKRIKELKQ